MKVTTRTRGLLAAGAYKLSRALGNPMKSVEAVASRSWEIAPGGVEPAEPLYFPEAHASRVLGAAFAAFEPSAVLTAIRRSTYDHAPTRAYALPDAYIVGHDVYCGSYKDDLYGGSSLRAWLEGDVDEVQSAVLASTYSGTRWFGHFLHDELPLQELVSSIGPGVGHLRTPFKHEPAWRSALDIAGPRMYACLRARELIWLDDKGQHAEKRQRYQRMRARITPTSSHERVLLIRNVKAGGETRVIENADAVNERLVREGFHLVDTGTASVMQMLEECAGASTVVSVEGSHAAPAYYFAKHGACLFYIYPPQRVSVQMPQLATFYGLNGAMFIGEPLPGSENSFRVDPDELMREIERAEQAARSRQRALSAVGEL
ncbi:MAG TPA: glycosyltransferase 61 family protein [Polyangiaceae bacterium]|nr:glycosyltransferase 61 family protein [Polyangiaceae bacterium]